MIEDELGRSLRQLGWTVGAAETCTGGLITSRLIGVAGSSVYVRGSVIAYANDIKTGVLTVDPAVLAAHGVVSAEMAVALAAAARTVLGVDLGIASTGIAGPAAPTRRSTKPVGLVYVAVAWPTGQRVEEHQWPPQDRRANMAASAEAALRLAAGVARDALGAAR